MQQNKYINYVAHKMEHDKLIKQVKDFRRDFQSGKSSVTIALMTFLMGLADKTHHVHRQEIQRLYSQMDLR
jgi:hemerythrin